MIRKLLLLSLSLFFVIGNATENEKIEKELHKICRQKKAFQERYDLCKQVFKKYETLLDSSVQTSDFNIRFAFDLSKDILRAALVGTLNKYNPDGILKREAKLRKKLARLEQQQTAPSPLESPSCADDSSNPQQKTVNSEPKPAE